MTGVVEARASGAKASTRTRSSKTTASGRSRTCATSRRSSPTTTRAGPRTRSPCRRRARELPPDRPPTSVYAIYPKAHIPPFHYDNPVERAGAALSRGARPAERRRDRRGARAGRRAARARAGASRKQDAEALVAQAERQVGRVKDFHEIDNLTSALRLLPRQESLERPREPVRGERLDRARAARRVHRPRARARVPVQRVRQGRARRRTGSATTSSSRP